MWIKNKHPGEGDNSKQLPASLRAYLVLPQGVLQISLHFGRDVSNSHRIVGQRKEVVTNDVKDNGITIWKEGGGDRTRWRLL